MIEILDIGLEIPSICPPILVTTMVFMIMKVLECLRVMEDVAISLKRLASIIIATVEFIVMVNKAVMMGEVYIGLKIPATLPLEIMEKALMLTGEVNKGLIPATIPPITKVTVVDC